MKITEDCINHNAMRLVKDSAGECWEITDLKHFPEMTLAYIKGVCDLADELKKVLKA